MRADAALHKVIAAFAHFEHREWLEWGSALMPSLMAQVRKEEEDAKVAKELEQKEVEWIMHEAQEKEEVEKREAALKKVAAEVAEKKWGIMGRWRAKEISLVEANEAITALETPLDAPCITTGPSTTGGGAERDVGSTGNDDEPEIEETTVPAPQAKARPAPQKLRKMMMGRTDPGMRSMIPPDAGKEGLKKVQKPIAVMSISGRPKVSTYGYRILPIILTCAFI